jgi:hypothetical protein
MGIKGQSNRRPLHRLGLPAQLGQKRGMTTMDAIEVADGDRSTLGLRRRHLVQVKHTDRHV